MTDTNPSPEAKAQLRRILRRLTGGFPAIAIPDTAPTWQELEALVATGSLDQALRLVGDLVDGIAEANSVILLDYERDRGDLADLRSDLRAVGRVLAFAGLELAEAGR